MMTSSPFPPILAAAFTWLTEAEVAEVAEELSAKLDSSLTVRGQMEVFARTLDEMGLRVTAPLLMTLTGRGSKTSAVEIVREVSRARFIQMKQSRLSAGEASAPAAAINRDDLVSVIQECLAQVRLPVAQASPVPVPSVPESLQNEIRQIGGNISWLRSMIDTERQLRRYMERHGPLDEPRPKVNADTDEGKRTLIGQLTHSLAQQNFKEGQPGKPSVQTEKIDKGAEGGEGYLDL